MEKLIELYQALHAAKVRSVEARLAVFKAENAVMQAESDARDVQRDIDDYLAEVKKSATA